MPREHQMIEEAIMSGDTEKARIAAGEHVFRLKEFILSEGEKAFGRKADKRRKMYNGTLKCQVYMFYK